MLSLVTCATTTAATTDLYIGSDMKSTILIRSASFHCTPTNLFCVGSVSEHSTLHLQRTRSNGFAQTRSALHLDPPASPTVSNPNPNLLRKRRSDTDPVVSDHIGSLWTPPAGLAGEEEKEEVSFFGGGSGKEKKVGSGGDQNEKRRTGSYYQQVLKSDPTNALFLTNYARFLAEVEGDVKGAEEYYGRAILSSPDDGEVLSLYGKLLWDTQKDEERATSYFERAVKASPDDCYVLGSYASFLWDTEEDEEDG